MKYGYIYDFCSVGSYLYVAGVEDTALACPEPAKEAAGAASSLWLSTGAIDFLFWLGIMALITNGKDHPSRFRP